MLATLATRFAIEPLHAELTKARCVAFAELSREYLLVAPPTVTLQHQTVGVNGTKLHFGP